jgi:hypothetical protein
MTNSDKKKLSPPVIGEEHGDQIKYMKKLAFKNPEKRKENFAVEYSRKGGGGVSLIYQLNK